MARIRTIKPEFPQSESMGRVSRDARLTFVLLWTIADDEGRLRGNSRMLASLLFPYDGDAPTLVDSWLMELEREKCIVRYKVDGDCYIEVRNWLSHQRIDHPTKSKIKPFAKLREKVAKPPGGNGMDQRNGSKDQGPKDIKSDDECPVFESFWSEFPSGRKQGKEAARKAFHAALKLASADTLIAAAREYAASPVGRGEFVKGPAPWLNQGCWNDDRAAWQRSSPPPRIGAGQTHDPNANTKDPNYGQM